MRICCVISSMGPGGAERVMAELCNWWVSEGHSVSLITIVTATPELYTVTKGVERISLNLGRPSASALAAIRANIQRVSRLREAIASQRPDVVVSFVDTTNVLAVLATRGLGVPIIVSERIYPPKYDIGRAWSMLRRQTYARADVVVAQTERIGEWARTLPRVRRVAVIGNPLSARFTTLKPKPAASRERSIIAIGRLHPQKGFDVLIRAFGASTARQNGWNLDIVGEGALRGELESLASSVAAGAVHFHGHVADPERLLLEAGIFVLSSRFEGFPNALIEAMACGCAVIATDCPSGPREILEAGAHGVLIPVDDERALTTALDSLTADASRRIAIADRALAASKHFDRAAVFRQWSALIRETAAAS